MKHFRPYNDHENLRMAGISISELHGILISSFWHSLSKFIEIKLLVYIEVAFLFPDMLQPCKKTVNASGNLSARISIRPSWMNKTFYYLQEDILTVKEEALALLRQVDASIFRQKRYRTKRGSKINERGKTF